jgi:murein DD-endopeptidase MepM/ murein hydrolase activator NlpD
MAFPRPAERGKHRRPRRIGAGAALAGLAVLGAGGAAAAALTSSGGSGDTAGRSAGLTRTADVSGAPAQAAGAQAKATPKTAGSTKPAAGASGTQGAEPDAGTSAAVPKPATSGTPKATATAKPKPAGTPKAAKAVKSAKAARTARPATPGTAAVTPEAAPRTTPSPVGTAPSGGTRETAGPSATAGPTRTAKPPRPAPSSTGTPAPAPTRASGWTLPVPGAPIGAGYKASGSVWSSGSHTGVDFLVPVGTAVHAVAAGTVVSAGDDGGYGTDVLLRHADGSYTLYGQLSQALVTAGQTVTEGQEIGLSGESGNTTGPNLHFEVRTTPDYGSDIDPLAYLREHGVSI